MPLGKAFETVLLSGQSGNLIALCLCDDSFLISSSCSQRLSYYRIFRTDLSLSLFLNEVTFCISFVRWICLQVLHFYVSDCALNFYSRDSVGIALGTEEYCKISDSQGEEYDI
jgi:hypothetical protein